MEGRRSGTPGADRAARRIAEWLQHAGLRRGGEHSTYAQPFVIERGARLGTANTLEVLSPAPRRVEVGRDWTPHGGSPRREGTGEGGFARPGASGAYRSRDDWAGVGGPRQIVRGLDRPSFRARV